jgi:UDPglucose 6-dehydrogenase/GDP-mannose 6-dehydrogenase
MKISIIGSGYVGLVTGVCLAEKGHSIICVDSDKEKVTHINQGVPPIYEQGLEELLKKNIHTNLRAIEDLHKAVIDTDVSLITVGTPFDGEKIDLNQIKEVSRQIGEALSDKNSYHLVIVKSTVVPGTTDDVVVPILEKAARKKAGPDFGVGMNPEFLREGVAVEDFMTPDRIVLGAIDKKSQDRMEKIYQSFDNVDKVRTNNRTAEMIKYTANSLLATMISFSNEIANLSAAIGDIDVTEVMQGVHLDKRLSPISENGERVVPPIIEFLKAGCGFGGSCFPKDVKALIAHGNRVGKPMKLLDAVIEINQKQPDEIVALIKKYFPDLRKIRIGVLGLAFKPGTDDMRESPAIPIVRDLIEQGAVIKAYDPVALDAARKVLGNNNITYCRNLSQTLNAVDVVVLLTIWEEFRQIPELFGNLRPQPLFIDGRRMLDKNSFSRYDGIGL